MTEAGDISNRRLEKEKYFQTAHLHKNLGGRTARGGALAVSSQAFKFLITIGATAVMARLLTPQDYGLIGMVAFVTSFLSTYKDLGLAAATIQRPEVSFDQISTLFWINLGVSAGITVLTAGIAPLVAWFYGEPRLTAITVVTALGFIISGITVQHDALLRRQMRYVSLSIIGILSLISGYIVGIYLAWRGLSYWALVASQLAVALTTSILTFWFCRWVPGMPRKNTGVRSMMKFGGNLTGFATINFFSRNLDNLLIGRFWGAQQLGIYSRAYQLMMLPIDQINEPVTSVAVPALSRLEGNDEHYRLAYIRMLEKIAILTMPGIGLLLVTSDWVVAIILGPQWREVSDLLVILGIAGLVQPISNTTGWLFITQGRTQEMFHLGIISGPITIISIVAGLPWGAKGVAISYVGIHLLLINVIYFYIGRRGPVRTGDFYRTIGTFGLPTGCAVLLSLAIRHWFIPTKPIFGILVCFAVTLVTVPSVLSLLPSGRVALRDVLRSMSMLVQAKAGDGS
jgi:PST family polysaccharide transporter